MKLKDRYLNFKSRLKRCGEWMKEFSQPLRDVIKNKHKFVVIDNETLKEKFSFQLSGINLFVWVGISIIVLVILTTLIIAFTPLREFIPGYSSTEMIEQSYRNEQLIDSLTQELDNQTRMLNNIKAVVMGEELRDSEILPSQDSAAVPGPVNYIHSKADSLLRSEVETKFNFKL